MHTPCYKEELEGSSHLRMSFPNWGEKKQKKKKKKKKDDDSSVDFNKSF